MSGISSSALRELLTEVLEIYTLSQQLLDTIHSIESIREKNLDEIPEPITRAILGGVTSTGNYLENSLALLTRELLGVYCDTKSIMWILSSHSRTPTVRVYSRLTPFRVFLMHINNISKFIVEKSKSLGIISSEVGKPRQNYEVDELLSKFMSKCINITAATNPVMARIWSLRKITQHYLRKLYPNYKEFIDIIERLGFGTLTTLGNYTIRGFTDYATQMNRITIRNDLEVSVWKVNGIPYLGLGFEHLVSEKYSSIGGALCSLNEYIWNFIHIHGSKWSRWFDNLIDVVDMYRSKIKDLISQTGLEIPDVLSEVSNDLESIVSGSAEIIRGLTIEGIEVKSLIEFTEESYTKRRDLGLSVHLLIDRLSPLIALGVADMAFRIDNKSALIIFRRWL